ncbi:MAG: AAA family ATPase [Acidobacteria bacterium]|nr:AAA family ATPase [Acidobacteriota bacterium]
MVGVAGSGKTTLCRRHFSATQIVSTDECRALLSDAAADQSVSDAAFRLAHLIVDERLRLGRLTVFDATSVQARHRRDLLDIAARHHLPVVAVLLDVPVSIALEQDRRRAGRSVGRRIIQWQARALDSGRASLRREGFSDVHRIRSSRAADQVTFEIRPLSCDRREEAAPFDIIGDVHGCADELIMLLRRLGYRRRSARSAFRHGDGRRAIFLGDLVDRGPRIVDAVQIVDRMMEEGSAFSVPGNHDVALLQSLHGRPRSPGPGLQISLGQIGALPAGARRRFVARFAAFVGALPPHLVLDGGRLVVAHAGLRGEYIGRESAEVRRFALHGETTGDVDRYGLPVRVNWAAGYRGRATLVYGHTPVVKPEFQNNTVNIDTGCVYGGRLTALRYPEMKTLGVTAARAYYRSPRLMPSRVGLRAETRARPPVQ